MSDFDRYDGRENGSRLSRSLWDFMHRGWTTTKRFAVYECLNRFNDWQNERLTARFLVEALLWFYKPSRLS